MDGNRQNPLALKIVSALFVFLGVVAIVEVFMSLMGGNLSINFNVLGIFIGPGLLRHRRGWRTCALVFIWLGLIGTPLATVMMMSASGPLDVSLFGRRVGHAPKEYGIMAEVFMFFLSLSLYRILTRPEVRGLFIPQPQPRWMRTG